jgi:hypothetical protein
VGNTNTFVLPSVLSASQITLAPQSSDFSVTLTVQSNGDGADGEFLDTTVEARDDTHHLGQEQTDTVRTTIQIGQANCDGLDRSTCRNTPGCEWVGGAKSGTCQVVSTGQCTYNDQSVTISPTAQDITTDGGSTVYTVNVTNNDTVACAATTFNLFVTDSDTGENFVAPSILGLNSVTLDPGASQNVDLTVTGQAGAPNGAVNNTSVTAADPASNHVNVTSNTVTTTINLGGPVNCSMYMDKQTCNNDPNCKWRSQECQPR